MARTEVVGIDYETLFHSADQALYKVKRSGRGRYDYFDGSVHETLSAISPIDSSESAGSSGGEHAEKGEE